MTIHELINSADHHDIERFMALLPDSAEETSHALDSLIQRNIKGLHPEFYTSLLERVNSFEPDEEKQKEKREECFLFSAYCGNNDFCEILLHQGVPINTTDGENATALHLAAECNRTDTCDFLLQYGAELEAADSNGNTPILYALHALEDEHQAFDLLLASGAEIFTPNNEGDCAFSYAACNNAVESLRKMCITRLPGRTLPDSQKTVLHRAIRAICDREIYEILLAYGADPDAVDDAGKNPHDYAVEAGNNEYMSLIMERTAAGTAGASTEASSTPAEAVRGTNATTVTSSSTEQRH